MGSKFCPRPARSLVTRLLPIGCGALIAVGCHPELSPEASVARDLIPGLEIGDTLAPGTARLTDLEFNARSGFVGRLADDTSPIGQVGVDADVSERPPSRAPRVLGVFLVSKPGRAADLTALAESASKRAYGRPPEFGCSVGPPGAREAVKYWRSRQGGVWIFPASDSTRSPTRVFVRGPALAYPTAVPQVHAGPCDG
jgi:hypothetical protein